MKSSAQAPKLTLREVIERLELATGPDRELDAEIAVSVEPGEIVWLQANYTMEQYPAIKRARSHYIGGFAKEGVPSYTSSIDAALTLVPEGCIWNGGTVEGRNSTDPQWRVTGMWAKVAPIGSGYFSDASDAPTAPLAICIAALRARLQTDSPNS